MVATRQVVCVSSILALSAWCAAQVAGTAAGVSTEPSKIPMTVQTASGEAASKESESQHAVIVVAGRGAATSAPDRAVVSLGVQSQRPTAGEAQVDVNLALKRSLEALSLLGIDQKAISTQSINLYPVYDTRPNPRGEMEEPRIVGYRANNTIRITLDDLSLIGKVIDACIKAGCNQLEGVGFELKDDTPQRRLALSEACLDARAKAETIAQAMGLRIIGIEEVVEGGVGIQPPIPMFRSKGIETMMAGAETNVTPGQVRVEASVTVRYRIEASGH